MPFKYVTFGKLAEGDHFVARRMKWVKIHEVTRGDGTKFNAERISETSEETKKETMFFNETLVLNQEELIHVRTQLET